MGKNKILNSGLIAGFITTVVFIGGCAPEQTPEGGGGFDWMLIVFLVLIFGLMYFILIRPQRKRQKERQALVEELKRGDTVITAGGIYGVIESISEDSVVIKVESGATIRVAKGSITGRRER